MRMRPFRVFVLSLVLLALHSGCRKPDSDLGLGLQPEGELLDLRHDTLGFSIEMVLADSLRTDERSRLLLGNLFDPISGMTKASFSTEMRLSETNKDFGVNPICDSIYLSFRFSGPAYGRIDDQYMVVEQLMDTVSYDSAYYSFDIPATIPGNLVLPESQPIQVHPLQSVFVGNDTLSPQVRIPLISSYGQSILDADTSVFDNNANWKAWFKGLQIKSGSGGGGIVCLEPTTGISVMRLHYHNTTDTASYDFVINANAARIGHFQHIWPPEFDALNDSLATQDAPRVALVGGASSYLRVDLSGLDTLNAPEGAVVNRAELVLPLNSALSKLPRPSILTAFLKRESGGLELAPEATSPGITYGGVYDAARDAYVLNLPLYAQRRLNGEEARPDLYLYSEISSVAIEQAVFDTPIASSNASFVVTWSE
ncbi:MAG: DUF4270 family protein [Flavobacteriales bacterium]|nr:DUF4270 family protein [Flavobacteriales bacterium]